MDAQTQQNFDLAFYIVCGILGCLVLSALAYVCVGGDRIKEILADKFVTPAMMRKREERDEKRRAKQPAVYGSVV